MSQHPPDHYEKEVLLAVQECLVGEVGPALRVVTLVVHKSSVHLTYYFDGEPSEDDLESAEIVETELMALLDPSLTITHESIRFDHPGLISIENRWVYARREVV